MLLFMFMFLGGGILLGSNVVEDIDVRVGVEWFEDERLEVLVLVVVMFFCVLVIFVLVDFRMCLMKFCFFGLGVIRFLRLGSVGMGFLVKFNCDLEWCCWFWWLDVWLLW